MEYTDDEIRKQIERLYYPEQMIKFDLDTVKMLEQLLKERDEARDKVKSAGKAVETLINHANKVYMEMFK